MRRFLESSSAFKLPNGFHMERVQWLYEGSAISASKRAVSPPLEAAKQQQQQQQQKQHLLYWMQTSVRGKYNYSLEYAIAAANALALPLHVVYFLSDLSVVPKASRNKDPNAFGFATERHAKFGLEGLYAVQQRLRKRGLSFEVFHHSHATPTTAAKQKIAKAEPTRCELLDRCARDAVLVITDRPYLRPWCEALDECVTHAQTNEREWGLVQVEGDVVVPCETVSKKEEYAARTIRPKITSQLARFVVPLDHQEVSVAARTAGSSLLSKLKYLEQNDLGNHEEQSVELTPLDVSNMKTTLALLDVDRSVRGISTFIGGEDVAVDLAKDFLEKKLTRYADDRNEPSGDGGSNLSLYLHYGHICPVRIAITAKKLTNTKSKAGKESFLEEMIVRRELAVNMIVYNKHYDSFACLPEYATITLQLHAKDKREHLYTLQEMEAGKTYDAYWNAAQMEVVTTGKMHGYMRMYWGKKILEWTSSPEEGFRIALWLNNKYSLDAPDPNSYTGIAWIFGKHDQGWKERPIFGKVRYMNESGLKRKFRMDAYLHKVKMLVQAYGLPSEAAASSNTNEADINEDMVETKSPAATKKRKTIDSFYGKEKKAK
uniref:Deoxyribodipyrimidine photo-lyase n=1 Tax=Globisporangium ultimum (strain ATCC 200006 / CBS 805.95 / DAOM BR144) TaxID=431595 RepID=K3WHR1_GLOUD